jgi:hypothetical protein
LQLQCIATAMQYNAVVLNGYLRRWKLEGAAEGMWKASRALLTDCSSLPLPPKLAQLAPPVRMAWALERAAAFIAWFKMLTCAEPTVHGR